jgi:hypothetical protein
VQSALVVQTGLTLLGTQRAVLKSQRLETAQSASLLHVVRKVGGVQTQAGKRMAKTNRQKKEPYITGRRIIKTSGFLKAYFIADVVDFCVCRVMKAM